MIKEDEVYQTMLSHGLVKTEEHTRRVVKLIIELAAKYNYPVQKAVYAALLHDIAGIVPKKNWSLYCEKNGIALLSIEKEIPVLMHQKVSAHVAEHQYQMPDEDILSAIACHTTLKANYQTLDLLLFVSDKLEWDQNGEPPYKQEVLNGLKLSLEAGTFAYLDYVLKNGMLLKPHPALLSAYNALEKNLK